MIFEEFDFNIHDYHKIAEYIYSVDFRTYLEVFKTKKNAIMAIEELILIENKDSNFNIKQDNLGKNPKTYVVLDDDNFKNDNDSGNIIGLLEIAKGKKYNFFADILHVLMKLKFSHAIRFSYIYFLDSLVLSKCNEDDLYLAEIAIDQSQRGKGFGRKIIRKVIEEAKKNGFKRVVLDVDLRNIGATKLYESIGFKKFDEKSSRLFNKERGMINMEYIL